MLTGRCPCGAAISAVAAAFLWISGVSVARSEARPARFSCTVKVKPEQYGELKGILSGYAKDHRLSYEDVGVRDKFMDKTRSRFGLPLVPRVYIGLWSGKDLLVFADNLLVRDGVILADMGQNKKLFSLVSEKWACVAK